MRLLLDTHTFLWLDGSPEHLSPAALAACEEPTNELYLSVVSAWEIQIKHQINRLQLDVPQQFPLMLRKSYVTMGANSSLSVSTIGCVF